ncbi:BTB/POZ domain-containing protein At1g04390 isoform X2 [Argentina anserina]|nr:BTB/POZ domain-containing protein At1g04390 isoform X2 [Potentilla anserina]
MKSAKEVWDILEKTESVSQVIGNLRSFSECVKSFEYFQQMALLLSTILWWWSPSRYSAWSDAKLMKDLNDLIKQDVCHKVAVLKLYSAVALCGNGAKKLLEGGEALSEQMVQCMDNSHPYSVRIEAFKLAQCLTINEQKCLQLMNLSCQPIIKAIISGMSDWSSHSRKVTKDQMSLLVEACRLALISRWAGEHHIYFWKQKIDKILLDLLLEKFHNDSYEDSISLEEQIVIAKEGLSANYLLSLRSYVWDILGWLAIHCGEDFNPETEFHLNILIACACLTFVEAIQRWHKIYENDIAGTFRSESATRAVLMMIYSPCKYIASKSRFILSEILKPKGLEYLNILLRFLDNLSSGNFAIPDKLQIIIYLMGFICYSGLEEYEVWIIKQKGVKTLFAFMRWCLSNHFQVERLNFAPHLHNMFHENICCSGSREWEGNDILLLYSLLGLAELIKHSGCVGNDLDRIAGKNTLDHIEAELVIKLQDICNNNCTPGVQWFATYVLSYFGFYGFPSNLMKRIGKAINDKDSADLQFILTSGECFSVHGVVVAIQCPSLLPPEKLLPSEISDNSSVTGSMEVTKDFQKDIRLSAHVDRQAFAMLLEYIYLGYLQAGEELVEKLRTLAKCCNLRPLLRMLCRKPPKWGATFPSPDLSAALGPSGQRFSDLILEAKETKLLDWTCGVCSLSMPHMHVHKVVLSASCDYLRALFRSGMQESTSQVIKVSISWEAMVKLVDYFYSGNLPKPPLGCIWNNMSSEEKIDEVQPYVELFWLSEFWIMEDVQEACSDVIVSCLDSARQLAIKILQIAANLSLWNLAEVAAAYMAPLYRQLCDSGELETLDEVLAEMVRVASVRFSQMGGDQFQLI